MPQILFIGLSPGADVIALLHCLEINHSDWLEAVTYFKGLYFKVEYLCLAKLDDDITSQTNKEILYKI